MLSAQNRQEEAFQRSAEDMVEEFGPMIYKLAFSRLGQTADAEDLMQDVFMKYLEHQPQFNDAEHAKAWFLRVTCNQANSYWRKTQSRKEQALEDYLAVEETSPSPVQEALLDPIFRRERDLDLEHCLEELGPKARELVHLYYYEEQDSSKLASLLSIAEGSVRMQLTRARRALKACLERN